MVIKENLPQNSSNLIVRIISVIFLILSAFILASLPSILFDYGSIMMNLPFLIIILTIIIGIGLLMLKNWARLSALFLFIISEIGLIILLIKILQNPQIEVFNNGKIMGLIAFLINIIAIWYILRKDTKEVFN